MQFGAVLALPVSVLATIFTKHLCTALTEGDTDRVRGMLRDAMLAVLALLILSLGIAAALMPMLCRWLHIAPGLAGYLAVGYGLVAAVLPLLHAALQSLRAFGALGLAAALAAPARLCMMLILLPMLGLSGYFLGQMSPLAVHGAIAALVLLPRLRGGKAAARWGELAKPMLRYALRIGIGLTAGALMGMSASFTIRHALPAESSAAYYLFTRFADIAAYCGATIASVLFPYAVEAGLRGAPAIQLRNRLLLAMTAGGCLLAAALWIGLPILFRQIPGYAPYAPTAHWAAYLTITVTLNTAVGLHCAEANARDDLRYLRYTLPAMLGAIAIFTLAPIHTLETVLHILFAAALVQAAGVLCDLRRDAHTTRRAQ